METLISPISAVAKQDNAQVIQRVRHLAALTIGAAAGVLRLESLHGFAFYIAASAVTSLFLFIFVGPSIAKYSSNSLLDLGISGVFPAVPGFILAWVLVYGIVEA